jgi:hypothetical protein
MKVMVDDSARREYESSRGIDEAPAVGQWTTNVEALGVNEFRVFAKNFILLVVLADLVQLIRRLVVKPSDTVDRKIGIWEDRYGLPIFWKFLSLGV